MDKKRPGDRIAASRPAVGGGRGLVGLAFGRLDDGLSLGRDPIQLTLRERPPILRLPDDLLQLRRGIWVIDDLHRIHLRDLEVSSHREPFHEPLERINHAQNIAHFCLFVKVGV